MIARRARRSSRGRGRRSRPDLEGRSDGAPPHPFRVSKKFWNGLWADLYPFQVFEKVTAGRISCERSLRQKVSSECLHCLPHCRLWL